MAKGRPKTKHSSHGDYAVPTALTSKQNDLIKAIHKKEMIVTTGPAGTGKTFIPSCFAGAFYKQGKVDRIIITRPNIPTGKTLGCFPGYLEEKMSQWTRPIVDCLEDFLGKGAVETMIKSGSLEMVPFETIRGRSWDRAFIILDEAQNCTKEEIKAFVTRIGKDCTVIVNGDLSQSDLRDAAGLQYLIKLINTHDRLKEYVEIVQFGSHDIVRSGLCKYFVEAFELI